MWRPAPTVYTAAAVSRVRVTEAARVNVRCLPTTRKPTENASPQSTRSAPVSRNHESLHLHLGKQRTVVPAEVARRDAHAREDAQRDARARHGRRRDPGGHHRGAAAGRAGRRADLAGRGVHDVDGRGGGRCHARCAASPCPCRSGERQSPGAESNSGLLLGEEESGVVPGGWRRGPRGLGAEGLDTSREDETGPCC